MKKLKAKIAVATLATALLMTGCSASNQNAPNKSAAPEENKNPELSVYNTPTPERIDFMINPGNVKPGTAIRVAAYNGGFDNKAPGCNGDETTGVDVIVNSKDEIKGSLPAAGVGNVRLVMTMPGYASSCTGDENTITVKWAPELEINALDRTPGVNSPKEAEPNEKFTISVFADVVSREQFKENVWQPMTITAHGPYNNLPELQAAGCPADAPIAATLNTKYNYAKAGTGETGKLALSVSSPGVYWFTVDVAGGERVMKASATSCTGDVSEGIVIVE